METPLKKLEDIFQVNPETIKAVRDASLELDEIYDPTEVNLILNALTSPQNLDYLIRNSDSPDQIHKFLVPGKAHRSNEYLLNEHIGAFSDCVQSERYAQVLHRQPLEVAAFFNAEFSYISGDGGKPALDAIFEAYSTQEMTSYFNQHGLLGLETLTDISLVDPELVVPFIKSTSKLSSTIGRTIFAELNDWFTWTSETFSDKKQQKVFQNFVKVIEKYAGSPENLTEVLDNIKIPEGETSRHYKLFAAMNEYLSD